MLSLTRPIPRGLSRRFPGAAAATVAAATVLALAACTGGTTTSPTSTTSPASAAARVAIKGAPASLNTVLTTVYVGGNLGPHVTEAAGKALARRAPATTPVTGKAAIGSWFGTPVAIVTAGEDVTLAVGPDWKVVGGWWPSLGLAEPTLGTGPRWVLAIGFDARPGESLTRSRADVLQVIGLDGSGGGGVMGLARDLWVPLSTGGKGKINAAMVAGGPKAQLQTVRTVTGLPIEGYVVIGFTGFKKVVNEQGGIPIVIPKTVNASHAKLVIKAGPQVLSGKEALAYARERKTLPDGDFGRSRHQGELILAAAVKAKTDGPIAIPAALSSFSKVGASDLDAAQILTYTAGLHRLNPMKVGRAVAKGPFGWAGGASIVVLGKQARALFAQFKDGNLP